MAQLDIQPSKIFRGTVDEVFSHRDEIPPGSTVELKVFEELAHTEDQTIGQGQENLVRNGVETPYLISGSEEGLAIMREIARRHQGRRVTDGSATQALLDEARAGAAYGYDPTE